jgi:hypothetical protein
MARTLTATPRVRRWGVRLALVVAALALFVWLKARYGAMLHPGPFFDGWLLIASIVVLSAFNLRKKLTMLPLGSASTWTAIHISVGFLAVGLFFSHAGFALPQGALEIALWVMFLLVAASGCLGLYLTNLVPRRLGEAQSRALFERIPQLRARLAREVADIAERSVHEEESLTISNFYAEELHAFMAAPRNVVAHLSESRRPLIRLLEKLEKLERYADAKGHDIIDALRERVVAKNDLDYQYAQIAAMRLWLFVHIPCTYSLLVLAAVHIAAAYAFSSVGF